MLFIVPKLPDVASAAQADRYSFSLLARSVNRSSLLLHQLIVTSGSNTRVVSTSVILYYSPVTDPGLKISLGVQPKRGTTAAACGASNKVAQGSRNLIYLNGPGLMLPLHLAIQRTLTTT